MGYAEFGDETGRPLIFCHGFPSSRRAGALIDDAAKATGVRVVAPDRPGHGLSDFKRSRRVGHWVDDVKSLADALEIERFMVLGFSAGGPYAAACAALLPDRVDAAGIASGWAPRYATRGTPAPHLPFFPALGRHLRVLRRFALSRTARRVARDGAKVVGRVAARSPAADRSVLSDERVVALLADDMREAFTQGARGPSAEVRALKRPWGFKLEAIRGPVWLWHGADDTNVPAASARAVSERIPGVRATFYRSDSHFSTLVNHAREMVAALAGTER